MMDYSLPIARKVLVSEQHSDVTLEKLFKQLLPASEVENGSRGYYEQDRLLVRKWNPATFVMQEVMLNFYTHIHPVCSGASVTTYHTLPG